jgi:hypothetical protein
MLLYPPSPCAWNSFNRSQFSIFIHEYIILPYSLTHTLSPHLPPIPTGANTQIGPILPFCSLFLEKDIFVCVR